MSVSEAFSIPFFTVINLLPHQVLSDWRQVSGWSKTVSFRDHESEPFTISYQFPSLCRIPRVRGLMWGSEPSQQCKNFFVLLFSTLCVTHPAGMGFDFYRDCAILLSHCGFLFGFERGISFFARFQCPPSTASCNFGAHTGDEHAHFLLLCHLELKVTIFFQTWFKH